MHDTYPDIHRPHTPHPPLHTLTPHNRVGPSRRLTRILRPTVRSRVWRASGRFPFMVEQLPVGVRPSSSRTGAPPGEGGLGFGSQCAAFALGTIPCARSV